MRGFAGVQKQNPDGRIDLWGGSTIRGQSADVSSLPRFFEAAYDVARRSIDSSLQYLVYSSMKNYLETVKYRKLEGQKQNSETELAVTQEKEEAIFSKAVTRTWKQIINLKTIKVDGDSSLDNTFFDTYEKLHQYFTDKYGKLSNP